MHWSNEYWGENVQKQCYRCKAMVSEYKYRNGMYLCKKCFFWNHRFASFVSVVMVITAILLGWKWSTGF